MASNPKPGDFVMAMHYPIADGGEVAIALVFAVHPNNVVDAICFILNPAQGALGAKYGLTEVANIEDVNGGVAEAPGVPFVPGTWCRREVCG
jgi:hypothetical protein